MLELTFRDWMVIVGSLLIVAVIIDALRRMRQQSRDRVRMKLAAAEVGDGDLLDDISSFRELPNGGARVVSRDQAAADDLSEDPATPDAASTFEARRRESIFAEDAPALPQVDQTPQVRQEPPRQEETFEEPAATADSDEVSREDDADVMTGVRAGLDEPANLDWLEDLPAQGDVDDGGPEAGELPRDAETEVIVLHVSARDGQGFSGADILEILLACDLRFGDMSFFHRHEYEAGRGAIQFSVANMLQPGIFDIDNMDAMHTRGLVFFLTLPGPENMLQAFDYMLETARAVAKNLNGELLDESRSVLTQQSVEHSRQQIRELERRLLARRV